MIKVLFNIFKRDQKSIKYLKMSQPKKIIMMLLIIGLVLFGMSSFLMPIILNADKIKETLFFDAGVISLIIGLYLSFIVALISSLGFLFSSCYLDKNLNNYLFLPIKPRDFIIAKILIIYYNVILITSLVFLPFVLLYLYIANITIYGLLTIIIYLTTMPIITIALSALVIGIVLYFVNKIKNKQMAKNILYGGFILTLLAIYLAFILLLQVDGDEDPIVMYSSLLTIIDQISLFFFYPNLANSLLINEEIMSIPKMLIISAGTIISFLFFEKIYYQGAVGFNETTNLKKKQNNKKIAVKEYSIIYWFFIKEAKEIFKTGIYFFNTIFGNIIVVVIYLALLAYSYFFQGMSQDLKFINELASLINIEGIILVTVVIGTFFTIFNNGAATVFSREARSLATICSLPINKSHVIFGKVLFHELVEFLTLAIFMVLPMLVLKISFFYIFVALLVMILIVLATNFIPVIIDLNFPNLDWESETAVVKSSRSIIISILVHVSLNAIVLGGGAFLIFVKGLDYQVVAYLAIIFYVLLFIVLLFVYQKAVIKAFRKVED